ncbi:N-acetylmuramoyl-L-alanine amidase [Gracilibacillus oryzae]|uniref:N-acetylmuramoyl-L-alanine amidase n=1 Tax=Gracilibacillus oryzae TaxID=1672701 RepID=A0A7C8L1D7_9BACI|nr:N-acetylmuramoyl-L-alanine amidase [Gracilibacillus oryzae]
MTLIKNKYTIERNYVTNSKARSGLPINKVKFLVAHETANNTADADAHCRYFQGIQISASAHTFIDDGKILEIIPLWEKAWHVQYAKPIDNQLYGDDANDCAIGTELCRTGDFKQAYDRYVWYHAYLCRKYGLNPRKEIISHRALDPQRRNDPHSWLEPNGVTWDQFINDVDKYYKDWNKEEGLSVSAEKKLQKEIDELKHEMKRLLEQKLDKPSVSDQPSEWAADVWKQQVMQGYFDGSNPKMPLTREQAAEVLDRFADKIREYEVDPLKKRVAELEKQVTESSK